MLKKIIIITLVVTMCFTTGTTVFAMGANNNLNVCKTLIFSKLDAEIEQEFDEQLLNNIEKNSLARGPLYDYKTEFLDPQRKTVEVRPFVHYYKLKSSTEWEIEYVGRAVVEVDCYTYAKKVK